MSQRWEEFDYQCWTAGQYYSTMNCRNSHQNAMQTTVAVENVIVTMATYSPLSMPLRYGLPFKYVRIAWVEFLPCSPQAFSIGITANGLRYAVALRAGMVSGRFHMAEGRLSRRASCVSFAFACDFRSRN